MTRLIKRTELAALLRCCERTIARSGLVPCNVHPPMFCESDVVKFLNGKRQGMARPLCEIPPDFHETGSVARKLGVDAEIVRRWMRGVKDNQFPHFRLSGTWVLMLMSDVSNWIEQGKAQKVSASQKRVDGRRKAKDVYRAKKGKVTA